MTSSVLAHELHLPASPASAGDARRFVRSVLREAGHADWCESAELAVSEVVTNAVLHAHTPCILLVHSSPLLVRIEVQDFSPVLPVQRRYTEQATTGRGLGLVSHLSAEHGVDRCPEGKVVWFVLNATCATAARDEDLANAFNSDDWDLGDLLAELPDRVQPQLLDVPVALWLAAVQHQDAVLRELHLYLATPNRREQLPTDPAAQLDLAAASRALNRLVRASETALAQAAPSTSDLAPLRVGMAVDAGPTGGLDFIALQDVLDYGWQLSVAGRTLVRPALAEVVALRDWACEQVISQLAGVPAAPWSDSEQRRTLDERVSAGLSGLAARLEPSAPQWDDHDVRTSSAPVVAADDRNRIIAVSPVAAALLGWEVDVLVGRRIATIIPPQLREAHVAGFTRHLATGEAHVLGVPVVLPVLCADGEQLMCELLIITSVGEDGRAVYVANIVPIAVSS